MDVIFESAWRQTSYNPIVGLPNKESLTVRYPTWVEVIELGMHIRESQSRTVCF